MHLRDEGHDGRAREETIGAQTLSVKSQVKKI